MPHFSQSILAALKEAVVKVFWKKDDVRGLFEVAGVPRSLIECGPHPCGFRKTTQDRGSRVSEKRNPDYPYF